MNSNIHSDADDVMKTGDMGFRYAAEIDGADHLWNRLGSRTGQRDPFCCLPAWQLAFNESRDPKSRILIRQSQDSLIAFSQKSFHPNLSLHLRQIGIGAQLTSIRWCLYLYLHLYIIVIHY